MRGAGELAAAVVAAHDGELVKLPDFVDPSVRLSPDGSKLILMVAVETKNETNERKWKSKNRRAGAAWNAVRKSLGPRLSLLEPFAVAYAAGKALKITFVRLGGRRLDQMSNLGAALKGCEDAIAYLLGANDGDPKWHAVAEQDTVGLTGVRIEVEIFR